MAQLYGRAEIARRKQRLSALMTAIDSEGLSAELTSHYARYLCVLVSGHAEQSVKELVQQYCRLTSSPAVQRYVGRQLRRVRNIDTVLLKQLVESFVPAWWAELEATRPDELQAFGSIAANRNQISHGIETGITLSTVKQFFQQISTVLDDLAAFMDPVS